MVRKVLAVVVLLVLWAGVSQAEEGTATKVNGQTINIQDIRVYLKLEGTNIIVEDAQVERGTDTIVLMPGKYAIQRCRTLLEVLEPQIIYATETVKVPLPIFKTALVIGGVSIPVWMFWDGQVKKFCLIYNPQAVYFGGENFDRQILAPLSQQFQKMIPEIKKLAPVDG